ncbi:MAG: MFS transporter [bacterium]|nr:MFS transporter [bacterium]
MAAQHPATPHNSVRTFYILILTQVLSTIGSRMTALALGIYLYGETGSVTPLALTALFQFLPGVIGSSIAGVIADRFDRRKVMALADAGQAVGTVLLLVSVASGGFQLWHLYTVTFIQSLFGMFQSPAFMASVTTMIPTDGRNRANALMEMIGPTSGIIAPMLAGLLYAAVGLAGVIALDLITFLVAVVVVLLVRIPPPVESAEGRAAKGSLWREVTGGAAYLWKMRPLFWVTIHIAFVNFMLAGQSVLTTPYILARTGSEAFLGVFLAAANAGALIGGLLFSAWKGTAARIHIILLGLVLAGGCIALYGMSQTPVTLTATRFFSMIAIPVINASVVGLIQAKVPQDLQGRVLAVLAQLASVLIPASYLLIGPAVDGLAEPAVTLPGWAAFAPFFGAAAGAGTGLVLFVCGASVVITSLIVLAVPSIRNLDRTIPDYQAKPETPEAPAMPPTPAAEPV